MLLLTTGARHPYKIDEKYLKKRNMQVEEMNPYNLSVYNLKELIWRDWREGTSRDPLLNHVHCSVRSERCAAVSSFLISNHAIDCAMGQRQMTCFDDIALAYSASISAYSHRPLHRLPKRYR